MFFIVLMLYFPTSGFDFLWDDHQHIAANQNFGSFRGLQRIWMSPGVTSQYYPLTFSLLWIIERFFGMEPSAFHLVNVFLHAANVILIFFLLSRLQLRSAGFAALVFAVHPVMVETVAWPLEIKNLLSCFFYLLALSSYLRFHTSNKIRDYLTALLFFIAALLSKTIAVTFPVSVLIIIWWRSGHITKNDLLRSVPFFIIAGALGKLTAALEHSRVGASGPQWDFTVPERVLIAGKSLWFYIGKLVFPLEQMFIYPRWDVKNAHWAEFFFPLSIVLVIVLFWIMRRNIGKGPLTALMLFIISLSPALGFINFYPMLFSFVADHFQYMASIGLIVLLTEALIQALFKLRIEDRFQNIVIIIYICVLALGTSTYLPVFKNQKTQWSDTIEKNPAAWLAYANRGVILMQEGNISEALYDFDKALSLVDDADIRFNRAKVHLLMNDNDKAIADLTRAIEFFPYKDSYFNNRGFAYFSSGSYQKALKDFADAIKLNPGNRFAWANMGKVYYEEGELHNALHSLNRALELGLDHEEAYYYRALTLDRLGRIEEALESAKRSCKSSGRKFYCDYADELLRRE